MTGLASRLLSNMLATRFHEAGIDMTAEQWGALLVLLNGEAMTQGQLGERLQLEKSSVSRLIDRLEKRGWITRANDPDDSRQKIVTPAQKAEDIVEHCATIARAILEDAQAGMTEDEMLVLRSLLSRLVINLRDMTK